MNKVLVVVTSYRKISGRIYSGADEWCDGWRFLDEEQIKLRRKSQAKPITVESLDALAPLISEDAIVWVRGKDQETFPTSEMVELIRELRMKHKVYLSYHDEFVGVQIANKLGDWNGILGYSLSSGIKLETFKPIIKTDKRGRNHLDAEADFNEFFRFFRLKPEDVFSLVLHKINGALAVIDLDLQYLEDRRFETTAWKRVSDSYKEGRATEKLKECRSVLYKNPISLKSLYEASTTSLPPDKSADLQNGWEHLIKLLPEEGSAAPGSADSQFVESEKILKGLDNANKEQVKKNFENGNLFREWMDSLQDAINDIKEVVTENNSEPVGV
jgi:hypothetical protein